MTDPRGTARFGPFEFDFDRLVLRRDGELVHLQPQPTELLALLLIEAGRLVTREELQEALWRDRVIEYDPGLNFCIRQVRAALGDRAASPTYIETVHRRGYRFIAPVEWTMDADSPSRPRAESLRWPRVAALLLAVAVLLVLRSSSWSDGGVTTMVASLSEPTRTTYRTALWLLDQGEPQRALTRLDSVRVQEPDFAEAWALTAEARLRVGDLSGARAAARRALGLDPGLAAAHYALGRSRFLDLDGPGALEAFEAAVDLEPDAVRYRQWYAEALANALRVDDAIRELETAQAIDPLANIIGVDLAALYLVADLHAEARRFCSESLELVPETEAWARDCLLTSHYFRGDSARAVEQARALLRLEGAASEAALVSSVRDYFRRDLERLQRLVAAGEDVSPFLLVRATARLEDRDATLRGLRALREDRHFSLQWAPRDVWFRFLHGDPEFEAILTEAGLPVPPVP